MTQSPRYVIPGQYITPTYKLEEPTETRDETEEQTQVVKKYISGKGTTISHIEVDSTEIKSIPVIVASLLGQLIIQEVKTPSETEDEGAKAKTTSRSEQANTTIKTFLVTVVPKTNTYIDYQREIEMNETTLLASQSAVSINLPQEGDIVLVRVTRLNPRQAFVEILSVEGHGNVISDSGLGSIGENAHSSLPVWGGSQPVSAHTTVASSQSTHLNAQASDLGETFKGIIRTQDVRSTERDKVKIEESFRPGDVVRAEVISLGDGSNYYLSTARNDLGVIFARSEGGAGGLMYAIDWQTMICEESGSLEARKCAKPFK